MRVLSQNEIDSLLSQLLQNTSILPENGQQVSNDPVAAAMEKARAAMEAKKNTQS